MHFYSHNEDPSLNIDNTGWTLSTIQATKTQLTQAFGPAMKVGDVGDKIQFNWIIKFEDGTIATIYDWKKPEFGDDEVVTWNIGGNVVTYGQRAAGLVHNAFREAHGLHVHSIVA